MKNNPECTKNIEFALYDHSMDVNVAERIIRDEMGQGSKYFISTMSKVNVPLSQRFPEIVDSYNFIGKKPVLICAVTSAPTINIKEGIVNRFYIRSQEEAKVLAEIGEKRNIDGATYIAVDDDYGKSAVAEFKKYWKGIVTDGVYIKATLSNDDIKKIVSDKIASIPESKRSAIFVCHYGNGIDNSINAIYDVKIKATILATSTLSIREWQKPIETILGKMDWYTCIPDYQSFNSNQNDVIKNFTTYALDKLIKSSLDTSFIKTWSTYKSPKNLNIEYQAGDFIIPMKVIYKKDYGY
ncbi:MAG: hypothetical protein IPL65_01170 [Lewinellaceae bacterium]|nr:hypothetical protein [Lewinellaceae bacterium]